jgi:hypothetical protein
MTRSFIDIGSLDVRVQEQVAEHGSVKDFEVALWRQEPDETGCNWNAYIKRVRGDSTSDPSWWSVIPEMRKRYNLN